ncbi:D-serine ammonia-lyase DSD1 [Aspergillus affinis]|uniref:D-serine ammonia-lyase DSD1 n=1 Tax=Aspergillus affinis TaxID=1070780 RepID=UPI0022FE14F8|nr:putative serine dehydratase domain-containing protein [Aspergillus affinis]KAI9040197.1 putative serine dehydratase domain-containing protein [Aspergillus affinis]
MDFSLQSHASFIGRSINDLPTPALLISKPILERNIKQLLQDVQDLDIAFRPHVKTLKSIEVTRKMLANGLHRKIVASTVCEIRGSIPLVKEGILDECLYGIPIYPSVLPQLAELAKSIKISLMLDNEQHVDVLEQYARSSGTAALWPVFIKVDVGSRRAGVEMTSSALERLVARVEASSAASLEGFYCHGGHSYGCRTRDEAVEVLRAEMDGVVSASRYLNLERDSTRKVVVSIGSTPTAHVVKALREELPGNLELELHAGNYPAHDLQQVSTGLVGESEQAVRVLAEVCSVYPERNEALVNAGTVALSKETSAMPGFGYVAGRPDWSVVRMSQEHGILGLGGSKAQKKAEDVFRVGDKVTLYCQHSCITAAAFHVYYVVDEEDIVRETWVPWKGW